MLFRYENNLHTNFDEAAYITFDDIEIFVKHFWDDLPEFTATPKHKEKL